jgi:FeS assembly SUF system regulator
MRASANVRGGHLRIDAAGPNPYHFGPYWIFGRVMLRISKLTDYATVVMTVLAGHATARGAEAVVSAQDLADRAHLELPTVSKLLKQLAHAGLVDSFRGVNGGYRLAAPADRITIAEVVTAMEGPIGMTECSAHSGLCDHESHCGVRVNWQRINQAIAQALASVTVADMIRATPRRPNVLSVALLPEREPPSGARARSTP